MMKYVLLFFMITIGICQGQTVLWKVDSIASDSMLLNESKALYMVEQEAEIQNLSDLIEQIKYPILLQEAGWPVSTFVFRMCVDEKGKTTAIVRIKPNKNWGEMDEMFVDVLKQARWQPAESEGKPISSWVNVPFHLCPQKN